MPAGSSWRLGGPLRAIGRARRPLPPDPGAESRPTERLDSWLDHYYGPQLEELNAACAEGGSYPLFRDLDDELWALLLTQQYARYPHVRALLPDVPERALQEMWNGASGLTLASQSSAFYARLRERYAAHGPRPLSQARVVDFGCGWGRLTRYLARDLAEGRLYGCDPVEGILAECRRNRVPAELARSDFVPERLPFDARFELAFAFSVFTHLSQDAHEQCLQALHRSLADGGILVATIRPPAYLSVCEPLLQAYGPAEALTSTQPRYLFVPHEATAQHPQYRGDGRIDYGEAVITLAYVRERWSTLFELLELDLLLEDPYQVMLTLRRR